MHLPEGLALRAYDSDTVFKGSLDLLPNEEPRKQYEFPTERRCPHCERTDRIILTATYFSCPCGIHLYRWDDTKVMPITEDMKRQPMRGGKPTIDLICANPKCVKSFRKLVTTESDLCKRCRDNAANEKWRKENPEKYKKAMKKHDDKRKLGKMSGSLGEI